MDASKLSLLTEDVISVTEAAREIPSRPNVSTVWRWTKRGVRGTKLQTVCVGSRIFTSRQAVTRFLEAINHVA